MASTPAWRVGLRRRSGCSRWAVWGAALALSAALTTAALKSADAWWLAWMSLLPLFWAIRSLGCLPAALAGGVWGGCLYAFSVAGPNPAVPPAFVSAALMTTVPSLYAGLCSGLTRLIGFNPIILGLGWILAEMALRPLGVPHGLLAGTQAEGWAVLWIGHILGSVFVAALLVCANASLLVVVCKFRPRIPCWEAHAGLPDSPTEPTLATSVRGGRWAWRPGRPRAPPIQAALPRI